MVLFYVLALRALHAFWLPRVHSSTDLLKHSIRLKPWHFNVCFDYHAVNVAFVWLPRGRFDVCFGSHECSYVCFGHQMGTLTFVWFPKRQLSVCFDSRTAVKCYGLRWYLGFCFCFQEETLVCFGCQEHFLALILAFWGTSFNSWTTVGVTTPLAPSLCTPLLYRLCINSCHSFCNPLCHSPYTFATPSTASPKYLCLCLCSLWSSLSSSLLLPL